MLTLGLPLWSALPADQKVALLGHEFAHGVNGDARHGVVIGTSLATLARLHSLLSPDRLQLARRDDRGVAEHAGAAVQAPLRWMIAAVFYMQQLISLRASQRAEYLADAIGARIASPASMAGALDVIVTGHDTYQSVIEERVRRQQHPVNRDSDPDLWDELRSALEAVPETERERRRRVNQHALLQVTETHPPTQLRIKMLRSLPPGNASVCLSAAREDKICAELAEDYARLGATRP